MLCQGNTGLRAVNVKPISLESSVFVKQEQMLDGFRKIPDLSHVLPTSNAVPTHTLRAFYVRLMCA
jgi:hypothetical protein